MRKLYYTIAIIGIIMITIGIVTSIIQYSCYNNTPREYFDSWICGGVK